MRWEHQTICRRGERRFCSSEDDTAEEHEIESSIIGHESYHANHFARELFFLKRERSESHLIFLDLAQGGFWLAFI